MIVVGILLLSMELLEPYRSMLFHSLYLVTYVVLVAGGAVVTSLVFLGRGRVRGVAPQAALVGIIVIASSLCVLDQLTSSDFSALFIGLFSLVVLLRSPIVIHAGRNLLVVILSIGGVALAKGALPDADLIITAAEAYVMSMLAAFILERYALEAFLGRVLLRERNNELKKISFHDSLTGLYNRHFFEEILGRSISISVRRNSSLSTVIFDVDHFKNVNDTAGHQAGDRVLTAIAGAIRTTVRAADAAARYGGEEFVVLLPDTDLAGAVCLAERVRAATAALAHDGVSWKVTLSAGVAELSKTESRDDFLRRADESLYEAKRSGRNRVGGANLVKEMP
jgi:diguanylate cyclase (GGDEF)-like protein